MSAWNSEFSSAPNFHPEFGLLCPSRQVLRRLRQATVAVAMGLVVVGGTALALVPQLAPRVDVVSEEGMRGGVGLLPENSASAAQGDADTLDKGTSNKAASDKKAPAGQGAMAFVRQARREVACDDLAGTFLSPQCQLGKAGKAHLAHAARPQGGQVAAGGQVPAGGQAPAAGQLPTVALGYADAHPQIPAQAPASASARAAVAAVTPPIDAEAPVVLPPARPPLPPKKPEKPVKVVHTKPAPTPTRDIASVDEPPPSPSGFDLFGLFHGLQGSTAWGMQR